MTWLQRYHVRHYVRNSIWVVPVLGMLATMVCVRLLHWIEEEMGWVSSLHPDTARAMLGTLAASMFTFVVFVSSALLVAVQLASAQLTPRIIAMMFKDPVNRFALTLFLATFTFSLGTLIRITSSVPWLTTHVAAYSCVVSLGVFLYMIDHVGKALRPSGALWAVGREGRQVIERVYPEIPAGPQAETAPKDDHMPGKEPPASIGSPRDGVVLAFDQDGLLALAQRANCAIEMVPQVGDHVDAGDPLFRIFPAGAALPAGALLQSIAIGQERTLEQDPTFPFRIMVDIASKALSPAINDPTTAVLALDEIHALLCLVGHRNLDKGLVRDAAGRLRLIYRTPDWEDFVHLAVTEIRHFGAESIQVARRLRAMLEDLIQTLPKSRGTRLRKELTLLQRSTKRIFSDPEDRALAAEGDVQGVGGKQEEK
jgi:uncharacterized membrane protein